jgi:hypothetical protein
MDSAGHRYGVEPRWGEAVTGWISMTDTGPEAEIRHDGMACTSRRQKLLPSPRFGKAITTIEDRKTPFIFPDSLHKSHLCY